jgi:hypothetical protein
MNAKLADINLIPNQCVRAFDSISKKLVMYNYLLPSYSIFSALFRQR